MTNRPIEDVTNYPRPPALEKVSDTISITYAGQEIVRSDECWRVLETFHPPTYYIPMEAFMSGVLIKAPGRSMCEWKGQASYFDIVANGRRAERAVWTYMSPTPRFEAIKNHIAVYAEPMDACFVAGEKVQPQPGNFYGGWKNSWIGGKIKGAAGTNHW